MIRRKHLSRSIFLIVSISVLILIIVVDIEVVNATDIQWKASKAHNNDKDAAAKAAPKSQRYWDEHNIQRPDYAKTDAEVAAERLQAIMPSWMYNHLRIITMILLVTAALVLYYHNNNSGSGSGGSGHSMNNGNMSSIQLQFQKLNPFKVSPEEEREKARKARLAHFEQQQQQQQQSIKQD